MDNVKIGDWVVNVGDGDERLTIGKSYKVTRAAFHVVKIIDNNGNDNYINKYDCKLAPQKYRNPPREEYRELCEAWLAGADLQAYVGTGWFSQTVFTYGYDCRINPDSILPQPDERKERIKKQLLNIDADKLAQLIIDSGIEL